MRLAAERLNESWATHDAGATVTPRCCWQCVAVAPRARRTDLSAWLIALRKKYSRRHASTEELRHASESLGVSPDRVTLRPYPVDRVFRSNSTTAAVC
jgi:hypothetical protein